MTSKVKQADIQTTTYKTTGTASAYELNIPKLDILTDEQVFFVQFHIINNATASLNINSLGAVAITTSEGNAIGAGDLKTTGRYTLVYDADTASFIVIEVGVGGGGGGVSVLEFTRDVLVGEGILSGQHCALGPYVEWFVDNTDTVKTFATGAGTVVVNYGEAFEWKIESIPKTLDMGWIFASNAGSGSQMSYNLRAKIYAITGTYGSTAVNTGVELVTSDVLSSSGYSSSAPVPLTFTFSTPVILPAGYYAVKIEGSATRTINSGGSVYFKGNLAGGYSGNAIDDTTPEAGIDAEFILNSSPTFAVVGDATDSDKIVYIGQAQGDYNIGDTGTFKYSQLLDYPGAVYGELYYLSDTPGEISNTPGTEFSVIGRSTLGGKVKIGGDEFADEVAISYGVSNYTNVGGVVGGRFHSVYSSINKGGYVVISISDDNVTWNELSKDGMIYGQGGDNDPKGQAIIPAGKFFKIDFITSGGSVTSPYAYFRPIK